MQNATLIQILNGIAIAAANVADMDTVSECQQLMQMSVAIVPRSSTQTLAANFYDAVTTSATVFLTNAGGTNNVYGQATPQFDTAAEVSIETGIPPQSLGT